MRAVVVYASQTGFTRRYAEWIAEELGGEAVPVERADGVARIPRRFEPGGGGSRRERGAA